MPKITKRTIDSLKPWHENMLVDKTHATRKKDSGVDTSRLEKAIDVIIYKLYSLTDKDICLLEKVVS